MTRRDRVRIPLALAAAFAAIAVFIALTGGVDTKISGITVRARSWERPALLAGACVLWALSRLHDDVLRVAPLVARRLPVAAMAWVFCAGIAFGTFAAGGADSYGYVSQAGLFMHGHVVERIPLDLDRANAWPDVPGTLAPLGYTRGPSRALLSPTYPPGLPLLMAPATLIHPDALFLIVPFCGALAVWCCWRLGAQLGEPLAGALAAVLLAASPTFLYQSVQPMSDVPATAFWMLALLLARRPGLGGAICAGGVASIAILIRPNLAPLLLLIVATVITAPAGRRLLRASLCAVAAVPGIVLLGAIQNIRYGSPLASGYGEFHDLFSLSNVMPNLARYPGWLAETHTPLIWLWIVAPLWIAMSSRGRVAAPAVSDPPALRGDAGAPDRVFAAICYAFSAAVLLAYLPYVYFRPEEWFYTRFLLPGLPLMLLLDAAMVLAAARRFFARTGEGIATIVLLVAAAWFAIEARSVGVFDLRNGEQKYPAVGAYARDHLPPSAVLFAMQHSGSLRYYSGRLTVRWDVVDRAALDRAVEVLRSRGQEPYAVVDLPEEDAAFRERFDAAAQKTITRMTTVATIGSTRIYRLE